MIEINDDMLGIWFVSWKDTDWMAGAWKTSTGPHASYRFRYYKDEHAFNSKDDKSWYDLKPAKDGPLHTDQEMIDACSTMATFIQNTREGSKKWELIRGASTFDQFVQQFKKLPFAHTRTLDAKDCRFSMKEKGVNVTVTAIHKKTGRRASATGSAACKEVVKSSAMTALTMLLFGGERSQ
jgi:hypothetical protein